MQSTFGVICNVTSSKNFGGKHIYSIVTAMKPQNNNELCSVEDNSPAIQQGYLYHVLFTN